MCASLRAEGVTATPVLQARGDVFLMISFALQDAIPTANPSMTFGPRSNTSHNGVSNELWDATVDGFQRAAQTLSVGDVRKAEPDDTLRLAL